MMAWCTHRASTISAVSVRQPRERANLAELAPQLLPRAAAVAAEIDVAVQAVSYHDVGVRGVDAKPVHRGVRLNRERAFLPARAAVCRALDRAALARDEIAVGDEHDVRIAGAERHAAAIGDRVALGEAREAVQRPALAFVDAAPQAVGRGGEN